MNPLLVPFELLYRGINRARRSLYRHGVFRPRELPRVVVSVGNLAMGGMGKTPAVIAIARELQGRGWRVAVLTRGYGRGNEANPGLVSSPDAARFGDEPVLIAGALPGVPVIVGKNRHDNAIRFLKQNDCDVFILDDGFQHLQLRRDIDVVLHRSGAHPLREGTSALRHAAFVIARRSADAPQDASSRAFVAELTPTAWKNRTTTVPLEAFRGKRVYPFSGLADNGQFFAAVAATGAIVAGSRGFPDHHRYEAADLAQLEASAAAAKAQLVTTEKDAVKLGDGEIMALASEMRIEPALLFFEALVERMEHVRRLKHESPAPHD